ncbi:multiple antibiotic resistance protein [Brachybacterium muris]|uniref:MarC family protein n=1 Tax=Brachybacterium muris TaxID=219301 RepID=UPI0003479E9E|nr:MarC family protein [Brachybacterium muris]MBM7500050.1 multiple antibiotic resistance protein [Brachybacterium muris]MCT1431295.1 MarC family protein [Brachybacterium muris]MCT2296243.1 MarC family protein [Brachybacterium muris]
MNLVDLSFLTGVFVTLFVIIDPPGIVPIFLSLTSTMTAKQRSRAAAVAVGVAVLIIGVFALFGRFILDYMHISLPALQFSGGLLLLIIALQLLAGKEGEMAASEGVNVALVPLGTPLLGGPGAIVAMMLFVEDASGQGPRIAALVIAMALLTLAMYLTMRFADLVARVLGQGGVTLVTRISGVLLAAISTQMVFDAVRSFLVDWGMIPG